MEVAQINPTTALTQLARLKSPPPLVQAIITEMLWQGHSVTTRRRHCVKHWR